MNLKIVQILFENKRNILSFIIIYAFFIFFVGVATMFLAKQLNQAALPDIEVDGRLDPDGMFRYKFYNDMEGLTEKYTTTLGNSAKVFGVTSRCFLTYEDNITFQKLYFLLYGVNDNFFPEVESSIIRGRLPEKGRKEALVGEYAAKYFNTDVGKKLNVHVTLNKDFVEQDKGSYVVSGIINSNLDYFKSAVIISKDTFEELSQTKVKSNIIWVYFTGSDSISIYNKHFGDFGKIQATSLAGSIRVNYYYKQDSQKTILMNLLLFLISGLLVFYTLLSYMFKGITKKIGLLKALGISDKHIITSFIGGFGVCSLVSTIIGLAVTYGIKFYLNSRFSNFLGFNVEQFTIGLFTWASVFIMSILILIVVYIIVFIRSALISPRDAMLKV
ncbi:MAG: ABC transporter permease [Firmicutes bacterium]|nr:ABC transporter permease [Bacillota bacterium]